MGVKRLNGMAFHNNKNGLRGVFWDSSRGKFSAEINPPGEKRKYLGRFETAEEAGHVYDDAARDYYGPDARLNFPQEGEIGALSSMASESGICVRGHDLRLHGYVRPDGRGICCRECAKENSRRRYERKTGKAPAGADSGNSIPPLLTDRNEIIRHINSGHVLLYDSKRRNKGLKRPWRFENGPDVDGRAIAALRRSGILGE